MTNDVCPPPVVSFSLAVVRRYRCSRVCSPESESTTLAEIEVELVNGTYDRHVFHFAVETTDGLGTWVSREINPRTRESVVSEPPENATPVAIHGVVDDYPTRGELLSIDDAEAGEGCLHVMFEYGLGEEPSFLESTDIRCT